MAEYTTPIHPIYLDYPKRLNRNDLELNFIPMNDKYNYFIKHKQFLYQDDIIDDKLFPFEYSIINIGSLENEDAIQYVISKYDEEAKQDIYIVQGVLNRIKTIEKVERYSVESKAIKTATLFQKYNKTFYREDLVRWNATPLQALKQAIELFYQRPIMYEQLGQYYMILEEQETKPPKKLVEITPVKGDLVKMKNGLLAIYLQEYPKDGNKPRKIKLIVGNQYTCNKKGTIATKENADIIEAFRPDVNEIVCKRDDMYDHTTGIVYNVDEIIYKHYKSKLGQNDKYYLLNGINKIYIELKENYLIYLEIDQDFNAFRLEISRLSIHTPDNMKIRVGSGSDNWENVLAVLDMLNRGEILTKQAFFEATINNKVKFLSRSKNIQLFEPICKY